VEESGRSCNNEDHDDYDDIDALMTTEIEWDYLNRSVEETGRNCNDEDHDDYDETALMTMEMERIRQSFGGRIRPKLQYEDPDDYDDTDCADEFGNRMGWLLHKSNGTTSIVRRDYGVILTRTTFQAWSYVT